ncbi:hypothetical protein PMIN06_005821 [Paraphaeosphaeria minitans]
MVNDEARRSGAEDVAQPLRGLQQGTFLYNFGANLPNVCVSDIQSEMIRWIILSEELFSSLLSGLCSQDKHPKRTGFCSGFVVGSPSLGGTAHARMLGSVRKGTFPRAADG